MPRFRIRYRPELGRRDETVAADRAAAEGAHLVLYRVVWVIGHPREIVARRLLRSALVDVA